MADEVHENGAALALCVDTLKTEMTFLKDRLQCCICLSVLTNPVKGQCNHTFCNYCIVKALGNAQRCPLCQSRMNKRHLYPVPAYNDLCDMLPEVLNEIGRTVSGLVDVEAEGLFPMLQLTPRPLRRRDDLEEVKMDESRPAPIGRIVVRRKYGKLDFADPVETTRDGQFWIRTETPLDTALKSLARSLPSDEVGLQTPPRPPAPHSPGLVNVAEKLENPQDDPYEFIPGRNVENVSVLQAKRPRGRPRKVDATKETMKKVMKSKLKEQSLPVSVSVEEAMESLFGDSLVESSESQKLCKIPGISEKVDENIHPFVEAETRDHSSSSKGQGRESLKIRLQRFANTEVMVFANQDDRRSPPKAIYSRFFVQEKQSECGNGQEIRHPHFGVEERKKVPRHSFDLDADSEQIEAVLSMASQENQSRVLSGTDSERSFTTSKTNVSQPPLTNGFGPSPGMVIQVTEAKSSDKLPFDRHRAGGTGSRVSSQGSARLYFTPKESMSSRSEESLGPVVPETDSEKSTCNWINGSAPMNGRADDGVISETDDSDDDLYSSPRKAQNGFSTEHDDSDSDESVILGTPSSQRRRRERSTTPDSVVKSDCRMSMAPKAFRAFLTSGLTALENLVVQKFVKRFQVPYAKDFSGQEGSQVSHVIVHQNEDGGTPRTMKFLMGISRNNFVVTIGWIVQSIKAGVLVDESQFIADMGDAGPRRTLEVNVKPLDGIKVFIKSWDTALKVEEIETLAINLGAQVIRDFMAHDFDSGPLIVLANEDALNNRLAERFWGFGAILASTEWLIECVSAYDCVSLYEYVPHPTLKTHLSFVKCWNRNLVSVPDCVTPLELPVINFGTRILN